MKLSNEYAVYFSLMMLESCPNMLGYALQTKGKTNSMKDYKKTSWMIHILQQAGAGLGQAIVKLKVIVAVKVEASHY